MNAHSSATLRSFLRASLPQLRLTGVRRGRSPGEECVVWLGPRVCWAANLAEFERVEIFNFTRRQRCLAHVRFGREGEVEVTSFSGPLMQPGDTLKICAYAWLADKVIGEHVATFVELDASNAVIEFRRVPSRVVSLDPASFPPPPAIELAHVVSASPSSFEAMD
jgi:aspartate 1-decarboxylase